MDFHESNQPQETYRWATDWVAESFDSLTTELGNDYVTSLSNIEGSPLDRGFSPVGFISKQNAVICCFVDLDTDLCEIGVYLESDGTYHPYLQEVTPDLQFKTNWTIRGLSKSNNAGDWVVVINDRHNSPKLIIIDSVNFDITKYYPNYNIAQLELFPRTIFTTFTSSVVAGGSLAVAPYIPFIQYERIDGTTSSCFSNGEILHVSKNAAGVFANSILGKTVSKSISITFDQDPSWYKVNVGLANLYTTECLIITSRIVTSGALTVTMPNFSGITLAGGLDNINILKASYNKIHAQTSHQGYLYLGGLESSDFNIPQSLVNTLGIKWVCDFIDPFQNTQKTAIKSFQPNEVYNILVRFWKDGKPSKWYHLKGREPHAFKTLDAPVVYDVSGVPEINLSDSGIGNEVDANDYINHDQYNAKLNFTGAKKFHLNDCIDYSTVTNTGNYHLEGEMSYWENENETYNLYFKDDDLDVGVSANFLNNKNVRFHKFPSKHYLNLAMCKKRYTGGLPNGTAGTTTTVEHHDKPNYFTKYQPQLGVKLDPTLLSAFDSALGVLGITYDRIELGHTQRDIVDSTVISEDLAHFGTYANVMGEGTGTGGSSDFQSLTVDYNTDAIGFTGGNFNSQTGYSLTGNSKAGELGRVNGDFFRQVDTSNSSTIEQMPNRQRVFNPEVVNDNDNSSFLNTTVDFVRHEVLMASIVNVPIGGTFYSTEAKTPFSATDVNCVYYTEQGVDNFPASIRTFQQNTSSVYRSVGRHFQYLFDYTLSGNVAYDKQNGNMPTWLQDYDIDNSFTITPVTNKKIVYAKSDFAYPTTFVNQQISTAEYRIKGDISNTSTKQPLNSVNRSINYGGNNHLHLKFDDTYNRANSNLFQLDPNAGVVGNSWEWNSLLKFPQFIAQTNNISQFFTPFHPAMNTMAFATSSVGYTKYQNNTFISTLMRYNTAIYNSFLTKEINIASSDNDVYYGDVFISEVNYLVNGFNMYDKVNVLGGSTYDNWGGAGINSCNYRFFAHTRQWQSGRRVGDTSLTLHNSFYPNVPVESYRFDTNTVIPQGYTLDDDWNTKQLNFLQSVINDSYAEYQTKFPYRILQSSPTIKESSLENWTNFPILNYYEIAKDKGFISNLQGYDEQLLIQTINTLLITKGSTSLKQGDFNVVLGAANIFDFVPNELQLGDYLGTKHQGSCLLTPFGYVFYDNDRRRLYLYDKNSGVQEISLLGFRLFFERYGNIPSNDFDDSFTWCSTYYDHKYRRILFTFESDIADKAFTISYYPEEKTIKSFHHYKPVIGFNTKNNFYGTTTAQEVIVFNQPVNTSRFLAANANIESIIDVGLTAMDIQTAKGIQKGGIDDLKFIQAFQWKTEVRDGLTENYKIIENDTFTKALVRTNKQASKEIVLTFLTNLRKFNNLWNFNAFRDAVVRDTDGTPTSDNIVKTVIEDFGVIGNTEANPVKRFVDTFGIIRLKYLTNNNKRLTLFNVDWLTKKTNK